MVADENAQATAQSEEESNDESTEEKEGVAKNEAENQATEEESTNEGGEVEDELRDALGDEVKGDLKPNKDFTDKEQEATDTEEEESGEEGEEAEGEAEAVTSGGDETEESEADTSEIDAYRTSAVDPGDFKPAGDYSFEVTTLDGKSHKISSSEEADNFAVALDKNPELISASQFVAFNRGLARMERLLEAEQWAWKNQKEAFAKEQAVTETRNATLSQWDKEIKYLRERGDLPTITSQFNNADWADAEIAKEPAVKETIELFDWMEGENGRREKVGLEPIKSVLDAFEIREAQTLRQELKGTKNKAIKTRQAKGAMVGGNAPHVPSNTPKDTIIGEGGSLNDLVTEFYNG